MGIWATTEGNCIISRLDPARVNPVPGSFGPEEPPKRTQHVCETGKALHGHLDPTGVNRVPFSEL